MKRLSDEQGDFKRYLIVISKETKNAVEKQIKPRENFPDVTVIDAVGLVELRQPEETDEDE